MPDFAFYSTDIDPTTDEQTVSVFAHLKRRSDEFAVVVANLDLA